jgi:type III secretion protein J
MSGRLRVARLGVLALVLALAACASPVAGGLDEPEADAVVTALSRNGVDATKENDRQFTGKFMISVSHDQAAHALAILASEDLPRPQPAGVLDAVGKGDLVPSADFERATLAAGLAGELEKTLEAVDGVLRARVHLNLPEQDPLRDAPPQKATASVLLTIRAGKNPIAEADVKKIVAGGSPSLSASDVEVVMIPRAAIDSSQTNLAYLGPIAVAPSSMRGLVTLLSIMLAMIAATTTAMLVFYMRSIRVRSRKKA